MGSARIVVGATGSGAGKTSLVIALVRALVRRGLRVQTFKVGPDFLDPGHLALASGRPCYNLDGWMCGRDYVLDLFGRKTEDADIAVVEGVMGLFDGAAPEHSQGSTAEIARWLAAPVLLVADARGVARSLAATVKGFATLEPDLVLAGVIANRCGSRRHADWLAAALASAALPPLLGAIPRAGFPALPSRHLGLVTADSALLTPATLDAFAHGLEQHASLDDILRIARGALPLAAPTGASVPAPVRATIGIARDRAFHFYYPDNLEALEAQGVRWVPFSPLADPRLPDGLDAIYLGGGYPEEQAAELAANTAMREDLRRFAAAGGAVYAECGGLMYLAAGIETGDGRRYPMTGILPVWTRMLPSRKALGYVEVTFRTRTMWGQPGDKVRGHEFHYSEIIDACPPADWRMAYEVSHLRAPAAVPEGFQRGRILGSYVHLHCASRPAALRACLAFIRKGQSA